MKFQICDFQLVASVPGEVQAPLNLAWR